MILKYETKSPLDKSLMKLLWQRISGGFVQALYWLSLEYSCIIKIGRGNLTSTRLF